jgi:hypothetical protein
MVLIQKNPVVVSHVMHDKKYIERNGHWLCSNCPFSNQCLKMRRETGEISATEESLNRFMLTNKINV